MEIISSSLRALFLSLSRSLVISLNGIELNGDNDVNVLLSEFQPRENKPPERARERGGKRMFARIIKSHNSKQQQRQRVNVN
jgi:hypothetical protein